MASGSSGSHALEWSRAMAESPSPPVSSFVDRAMRLGEETQVSRGAPSLCPDPVLMGCHLESSFPHWDMVCCHQPSPTV